MKQLILICAMLFTVTQAFAEVPKLINYSGKLTDKAGNIVTDGNYDMRFSLWDQEAGGTEAWSEEHYVAQGRGVQSYGGGFNVVLGGTSTLPAFDQNYWVEVTVTINSTSETFGRQQIISVPYALRANDGTPKGAIMLWTGATCPVGYRRMSELDGLFPRGATSYSGGHAGGADSHSHGGNTGDGGNAHRHYINSITTSTPNMFGEIRVGSAGIWNPPHEGHAHTVSGWTDNTTDTHNHPISTDSNVPRYFNVIYCIKE